MSYFFLQYGQCIQSKTLAHREVVGNQTESLENVCRNKVVVPWVGCNWFVLGTNFRSSVFWSRPGRKTTKRKCCFPGQNYSIGLLYFGRTSSTKLSPVHCDPHGYNWAELFLYAKWPLGDCDLFFVYKFDRQFLTGLNFLRQYTKMSKL